MGEVSPPVLIGAQVAVGDGARVEGPAVIGDGCSLGEGTRVKDSILLAGAELGAGAAVEGEIVTRPGAPDGTES
jgi:NDP-sugar pyrophosphorylase family protein